MKRKFAVLMYAICFLTILAACGSSNTPSDIDTNTPKSAEELADIRSQIGEAEAVTRGSGMTEKELLADLNSHDDFFEWFSPDAGFIATSIQINQRNTVKKESDEIYAMVTSINEYSSYTAEFYLYYQYYSEGGWRLEELFQNDDGVYSINYWPQEEDLYTVWDSTYVEQYKGGAIEEYEVESTGDNYVMFLVTYSRSSKIGTEYARAEVRFLFENGLWTTVSMSYPGDPYLEIHSDVVCGTYLTAWNDSGDFNVVVLNIYDNDSELRANCYEYTAREDIYDFHIDENLDSAVTSNSNLDIIQIEHEAGTSKITLILESGVWYYMDTSLYFMFGSPIPIERIDDIPNGPLQKADALAIIQNVVEQNNFTFWPDYESAQQAQKQEQQQDLEQNIDLTPYRQACIDYYSQFDISFPDNLDPCMYSFYLNGLTELSSDEKYEIIHNGPQPLDYMDSFTYDRLNRIYYGE